MTKKIIPILLTGGFGTRLWPLSRKSYPKQFSKLLGNKSLFQLTIERIFQNDEHIFGAPITLTNSDFRFIVEEQFKEINFNPGPILIEPSSKNTAPAILAGSLAAYKQDREATIIVFPSDHAIPDIKSLNLAIHRGFSEVFNGNIVTFGIKPTYAETGYGYLKVTDITSSLPQKIQSFIEKPNITAAEDMLETDEYLWNAGIFMFRAHDMIQAFKDLAPDVYSLVEMAVETGSKDLCFTRLNSKPWVNLKKISIDYAIMEKIDNIVCVPLEAGWSDLGNWNSVTDTMKQSKNGLYLSDNTHAIDCEDTTLRSESENLQLVGLGLKDIIAVAMPDAVLVCHKDKVQNVGEVVSLLKSEDILQAETFPKDHRPWGWFESLALSDRFQVKLISVSPGGALSLQSHQHRSEHWIVVEGSAKVTVNDEVSLISQGESIHVPLGAIHRMENPGTSNLMVIEVQTGDYFGEDDIIRYEDIYARN